MSRTSNFCYDSDTQSSWLIVGIVVLVIIVCAWDFHNRHRWLERCAAVTGGWIEREPDYSYMEYREFVRLPGGGRINYGQHYERGLKE